MSRHALNERQALAETLRSVEPNSATLCGDWTAAQLAAHLVLRERSGVELLGRLPNKRLHRLAARHMDELVARETYEQIVAAVGRGPTWRDARLPVPTAVIWALPPVRELTNLLEYLVHHEDVRRAQSEWAPRDLAPDLQQAVWKRLPGSMLLTMRTLSVGVALCWPGHGEHRTARARRSGVAVRVIGDPVELALFAFGRKGVARVAYEGSDEDIATVRDARLGI
jgi:uncharacterized protein (TIGR03085 family)